jgi:hypothetical protein
VTIAALLLVANPISIAGTITINSSTGFPQIDFNEDGTITYTSNGVAGLYYTRGWYQAANFGREYADIGLQYEIRLTADPGTFSLELLNTWVDLDTGTSWSRTSGNGSSTGLIEIRDATTQVVLGSCNLALNDN